MASPRTFAALARASSAIDRLDTPATFGGLRVPTCAASPTTVSPLSRGAPPSRASNARTLARDLAILAPILERASASSARAPPAAPRTRSPPARSPVPARHHERRERDASRLVARAAERLRDAIERASRATPTAPARDPAPIPILSPLVAERCGGDARPRGEPPDADADSRARPRGVKKKIARAAPKGRRRARVASPASPSGPSSPTSDGVNTPLAAHLLPVVVFDFIELRFNLSAHSSATTPQNQAGPRIPSGGFLLETATKLLWVAVGTLSIEYSFLFVGSTP